MKAALLSTGIGMVLCFLIGTHYLNLSISDLVLASMVANLSAFLSFLVTIRAERIHWIKQNLLNHTLKTWALFLTTYFGILTLLIPALRDPISLSLLGLPLIMSSGLGALTFGPVQDFIVRRGART